MRRHREDDSAGPPHFGLPEHSPFTIEGRIEQAEAFADHATGVRDGRERRVRQTNFAPGLLLIAGAFGVLVLVFIALYFLG